MQSLRGRKRERSVVGFDDHGSHAVSLLWYDEVDLTKSSYGDTWVAS